MREGIGGLREVPTVREFVDRLVAEYRAAKAQLTEEVAS